MEGGPNECSVLHRGVPDRAVFGTSRASSHMEHGEFISVTVGEDMKCSKSICSRILVFESAWKVVEMNAPFYIVEHTTVTVF